MSEAYQVCLMIPEDESGEVYRGSFVFRELVFLLRSALRSLGHDCVIKPNSLDENRTNIVIGYHLLRHGEYLSRYRYIPYQLEQLAAEGGWYSENGLRVLEGAAAVWDYSEQNIGFLAEKGVAAAHLPVGYHADLEVVPKGVEKDIDILFYGSLNARRQAILDRLGKIPGARVATATGVFGKERDELIARARIVLNMHYYETAILEQPRVSFLLNNGCFVVNEESADDPYPGLPLVTAGYDELADTCRHYLENPGLMEAESRKCYEDFRTRFRMEDLVSRLL